MKPTLKFGKLAPKPSPFTLALDKYVLPSAVPPPEQCRNWQTGVADGQWQMLANDQLGDCVIAAVLHWIMAATANTDKPVKFNSQQAIELYSAVTGYDPRDPSTDQGTAWTSMLAYWASEGVYGHRISAWAAIDYTDLNALRQAIDIFGGILIGTEVTGSMQKQFANKQPWNKPFRGGVKGLHGVPWLGYGREGQTCITWGARQEMDLTANKICDEAYAVITEDWLNKAYQTPLGINATALAADIEALRTK